LALSLRKHVPRLTSCLQVPSPAVGHPRSLCQLTLPRDAIGEVHGLRLDGL
jgi:hypothetical protein